MAAKNTLPQLPLSRQTPISKTGVLTLSGFGIKVRMQSGHLEIEDGVGMERRTLRLPRVGHGLRRLVCISEDGFVTLSALKWLADVGASFSMLNRVGKPLLVTGPTAPSDARLRRAQSLAMGNGTALTISKRLIAAKLSGEESLVRGELKNSGAADFITELRERLARAENLDTVRVIESHAAGAYWNAWRDVSILWPTSERRKVPDHWHTFGTRTSPLTGGPRLAVNPPNAILNYCFALLESETRLSLVAIGLDPGIGFLHLPRANRDSLVLDVMEAVRPDVERWLYHWVSTEPFRRADFYETGNGNCRLMSRLCSRLSETATVWGRLVAPYAEWVAHALWQTTSNRKEFPATRLTQARRRLAKGSLVSLPTPALPKPQHLCRTCGVALVHGRSHCANYARPEARKRMIAAARLGRIATHSPEAEALRAATQRQQVAARKAWQPSDQPDWLTKQFYAEKVQPRLAVLRNSAIASALAVSMPYAAEIRAGRRRPHPRHWRALAELVPRSGR